MRVLFGVFLFLSTARPGSATSRCTINWGDAGSWISCFFASATWVVRVWATYPHRRYGFGFMFAQLLRQRLAQAILALSHEDYGLTVGFQALPGGLLRHVAYDTNIHSRTPVLRTLPRNWAQYIRSLYPHPSLPLLAPISPSYLSSRLIYLPIVSSLSLLIIQEGSRP
ncbi:hypothetical protein IG631_13374 [Alternaria alternata]|nr:hypothetical protein IG631_13374 [Alternaria alternata]